MYIIIQTRFEKISHNIPFEPETLVKGKQLVKAKHVCKVQELRENGASFMIKALVIRQASVSSSPYQVALNINSTRRVISVSCTCVYKKSEKCKHVAALIYYINYEESLTKTDEGQKWGQPSVTQLSKEKYSKGLYFNEMFMPRKRIYKNLIEGCSIHSSELNGLSPLKSILLKRKKNVDEQSVKKLLTDIIEKIVGDISIEDCALCVNISNTLRQVKQIYKSYNKISAELKEFYNNMIVLSKEIIPKLCCDTISQAECDIWYEARKLRISGSKNAHCIKTRKTKSEESLVNDILNPICIETSAMRYGKKNEAIAKAEYEVLYNCKIKSVGVIVSETQPWLCASLDGFVFKNNKISKIIEVKCPESCKNLPIVDYVEKKCNVKYLKFVNHEVQLRESSMYYTQCQIGMYVSGVDTCDLFIYSPVKNGSFCLTLNRNEIFLKETIIKCEKFYFKHYLPKLHTTKTDKSSHFIGKDISNTM